MLSLALRALRPSLSAFFVSGTLTLTAALALVPGDPLHAQVASNAAASTHAQPNRLTQPIVESNRVALAGTVHPLANKANDRGAVSDGMKLNRIQVVLKRSDAQESALKQLIGEMHSPGSANYHKWLTPNDFGKQFGPSDADVAKVEGWLGSHGFSITKLNPGRQTLEIAGTAGQFRDTFHAQIHSYQIKGETRFANATDPDIPAALAPVFGGFASLNNFRLKSNAKVLGKAEFNPATHEAKPEWTIGDSSNYNLVLAPGDFNVQYDLNPLYTAGTKGDGQSIAIVNESNINVSLVNNYRSLFGLPANPPQVIIDGNDPGIDGINSPYGPNFASGEAYLDVELSGAVAPDATVYLVIADDTELQSGLTLAIEHAVYSNVAPIISLSFGGCEFDQGSFNATISSLWEQAAAQGITVLVSSGDAGSAGCDDDNSQYFAVQGQAVNGLGSTPYNVSVGGTDFYYSGGSGDVATYWNTTPTNSTPTVSLKSKVPEQPWNDSQYGLNLYSIYTSSGDVETSIAGGSGGASTCGLATVNSSTGTVTACAPYPKPSWQKGTGVPNDNARDLPDVSLFAANGLNNTYYPVCAGDGDCVTGGSSVQITGIGGTSASTPAFAGIMALVNQKYGRQGQANYVLYPLAAASLAGTIPAAFNDVIAGTNAMPCATNSVTIATSNGNVTYPEKDCQTVSNPLTVTDPVFGTTTEGEIGFTTGTHAYDATTGYDLASGLGTVDANNLVTNWGSVKLGATATTLTPSSTSFAHGTAVTISGAVAGTSPTGNVALVTTSPDPNNQGEAFFALGTGGTYTGSVNYLPGGTYNIYGYYAGDGSNGASSSTPVSITVNPEASTTALTAYSSLTSSNGTPLPASGGSVTYGSPLTFSATEKGATSGSGSTVPTGNVVFSNGSTVLNTAVVNAEGDAEFNSALAPGSYLVTAKYSGDGSYTGSTSSAVGFTVAKETPSIAAVGFDLDSNGENIVTSNGALFTAVVENTAVYSGLGVAAPSGTLTLTGAPSGTTSSAALTPGIDPVTGNPAGIAIFKVPAGATLGNYTFNFAYNGDTNYDAGSQAIAETLNSYTGGQVSTTAATASATATSPAALVSVNVTVTGTPTGGAPTGTVYLVTGGNTNVFYYSGNPGTLTASGSATSTTTIQVSSGSLDPGTNQITVQYVGDNTYYPSATTLTIANPLSDFSLVPFNAIVSVPNSGTTPGVQTDTINLTSYNGFAGAVALSCAGSGGVTCTLGSSSATLTSGGTVSTFVTVNTSAVTKAGTYNVSITGKDSTGNYIHTIGLQVITPVITVPSFTLSGTAVAISAAGGSGTSTITATPTTGFTGTIALTCAVTSGPAGAVSAPTCTSPASVDITGSSAATGALTINTTGTTTSGVYTLTVTGAAGSVSPVTNIAVTVGGIGSFSLSNSAAITIASAGGSGTSMISVTPNATTPYAGAVALACSVALASGSGGLPTCSLAPASVTLAGAAATSTLTVTAGSTAKQELPLRGLFAAGGGLALASLLFLGVPVGRRGKRAVRAIRALRILSLALFFLLIAGAGMGCGSGSSNSGGGGGGSTSSTYTVTITGTPTSGTAQTATVTVTVN